MKPHYERLTALDSSFLQIEDPNTHMHVQATLLFEPDGDWPVGQRYVAQLQRGALREGVKLESERIEFGSAAFSAGFDKAGFYQDPVDPRNKRVVATLRFSHPVDPTSLERGLRLKQGDRKSVV